MADRIQVRRDTKANWEDVNPVLAAGEFGFEIDNNRLKCGNGVNAWKTLPYITETDLLPIAERITNIERRLSALENGTVIPPVDTIHDTVVLSDDNKGNLTLGGIEVLSDTNGDLVIDNVDWEAQ